MYAHCSTSDGGPEVCYRAHYIPCIDLTLPLCRCDAFMKGRWPTTKNTSPSFFPAPLLLSLYPPFFPVVVATASKGFKGG